MSKRRIAQLFIPALTLCTLALSSSCKSKKAELQDVQLFNGQIRTFSLSSEDKAAKAALERVTFSIRNSEEGLITNPSPLPFAQPLNKVKLKIVAFNADGTKIDVAVGTNGAFEEWKASKVYDLSSGVSELRVRVRNKVTNPQLGSGNEYIYRVHLSKYTNDPQTFSWQRLASPTNLPAITSAFTERIVEGTTTDCYFVTSAGTNALHSFTATPTSWTVGAFSGIPSRERLTSVARMGNTRYATTSAGKLYQTMSTTWTQVSGITVTRILGTLPLGEKSERLALLTPVTGQAGKYVFATYTPTEGLKLGHKAPESFPLEGGYTFTRDREDYVGSTLYLVGGRTSRGTATTSRWLTTNGIDWAEQATELRFPSALTQESIIQERGTSCLYRFVTTATGLYVYISTDNGLIWEAGRAVALAGLTATDFASSPVLAVQGADAKKIYLIRGVSGGASVLYEGTIRREEHN